MPPVRIQPFDLVVDLSDYVDHMKIKEMQRVRSVIVGLYRTVKNGKLVLTDKCLEHCRAVVEGGLILQGYYYDDITMSPVQTAAWTLAKVNALEAGAIVR